MGGAGEAIYCDNDLQPVSDIVDEIIADPELATWIFQLEDGGTVGLMG